MTLHARIRRMAAVALTGIALVWMAALARRGSGHEDTQPVDAAARPKARAQSQPPRVVVHKEPFVRLTGRQTEDDYPVMATASDGSVWMAYVEYHRGQPIVMEQVLNRRFDSLVTEGHGDKIRLMRFDGQIWHGPVDVTANGLDVWRPTVTVDGNGAVVVAWAQQVDGDWEILARRYSPSAPSKNEGSDPRNGASGAAETGTGMLTGAWSDVQRVTDSAGADFHVVSTADAAGRVWLAWQAWRDGNFDVHAARLGDAGRIDVIDSVPNSAANEWSPAIAADQRGNVYLAWDSYEEGNYDVRLHVFGKQSTTLTVAGSARFEARPHLACDRDGRLWIAYAEGDEQWGKDYTIPVEWGRHRGETDPGFGLYVRRTLKVKCLADGELFETSDPLERVLSDDSPGNKSLPRLAIDGSGGLWLLYRRHLKPNNRGGGEAWHSFATRFDGRRWSSTQRLPNSSNLLDNRPALAAATQGLLAVYSGDNRTRTQQRDQTDLFACVLLPVEDEDVAASPPGPKEQSGGDSLQGDSLQADGRATDDTQFQLVAERRVPEAEVAVVHPNESDDVARMRAFRLKIGDKTLRLLRGDFHRHTEYTAHRDGDGLLEDSWRYALDAAQLDWLGNGDHDNGYGHEYHWWQIQKVTGLFDNRPHFAALQSYERSNRYPNGHRNVIMPRRGVRPLPRASLEGTPEAGTPDTKLLYDYLKHFGGICASHTSATGMGTDWRDNDPEVEPVVEIFQGCRQNYQSYEHVGAPRAAPKPDRYSDGYVWNALAKGYRLGFQASSDHFSTHISYAVVLAEDASPTALIDAFQRRHCYGANDNIVLVVRSGEHLMGDVFETGHPPGFEISVAAPKPIAEVHVVRNNQYVFTMQPDKREFDVSYTDVDAEPGESYYYYVRVEQTDGSLAWASPMWIRYAP